MGRKERACHSLALLLEIIHVDIARDDIDILESLGGGLRVDVQLLRPGVGEHGDLSEGVVLSLGMFPVLDEIKRVGPSSILACPPCS